MYRALILNFTDARVDIPELYRQATGDLDYPIVKSCTQLTDTLKYAYLEGSLRRPNTLHLIIVRPCDIAQDAGHENPVDKEILALGLSLKDKMGLLCMQVTHHDQGRCTVVDYQYPKEEVYKHNLDIELIRFIREMREQVSTA
ncbi:hypothetical protein ACLPJK_26685 [Pseudomonas aeruginosa]|uniref:hypothetical protein n=1 Tax=Pseudomonas aeruginosa TaxID=287 RepID=UPI003D2E4DF3